MGDALAKGSEEARWLAPKVITVPVAAFAHEWSGRPDAPVEIGLRIVPDEDVQTARAEAAKFATTMHEDHDSEGAIACYNDALLRWIIARSTCRVEDFRRPYFELSESTVRVALSVEGVKFIAHEIEIFSADTSPLTKPITDDELEDLKVIIEDGPPWGGMGEAEQRSTRRLLAVVLDRFGVAMIAGPR